MNTFLTKLAMLGLFLLAVTCGWAALVMVFPISLVNILLGILAAFFLLGTITIPGVKNKNLAKQGGHPENIPGWPLILYPQSKIRPTNKYSLEDLFFLYSKIFFQYT